MKLSAHEATAILDEVDLQGIAATEEDHAAWAEARRTLFGDLDGVVLSYDVHRDEKPAAERDDPDALVQVLVELRAIRQLLQAPAPSLEVPVLLDVAAAATILGITVSALRARVDRGQVKGVVRTGRRLQFNKAKLVEAIDRRTK